MNIECWQSWHISISSPGIDHLTGDHISRIRGQWSLLSQAWPGGEWSEWKSMPGMKSIKERRVMTTRPVLCGLSELLYQFLRVYRQWCDGARSWVTSVTQLCMHRSARHQPGSGGCRRRRARRKERTVDSGQTGERSQCETVTRPGHTEHTSHLTWSPHREGHTVTSDETWGTIKCPLKQSGQGSQRGKLWRKREWGEWTAEPSAGLSEKFHFLSLSVAGSGAVRLETGGRQSPDHWERILGPDHPDTSDTSIVLIPSTMSSWDRAHQTFLDSVLVTL